MSRTAGSSSTINTELMEVTDWPRAAFVKSCQPGHPPYDGFRFEG
jgi:hypothetical protein